MMESLVEEDEVDVRELMIGSTELFNDIVIVGKNRNAVPEVPEDMTELSSKVADEDVDAGVGGNGHQ